MSNTQSHSERKIYDECIRLMAGAVEMALEALEYDVDDFEDRFGERLQVGFTPFEIVQRLFLFHTYHGGGTSTRDKCNELGIDDVHSIVKLIDYDEGDI